MAHWYIAYCILRAGRSQYVAALQYTDVGIIKPVTGIAKICSASLKTTRRLFALGFHTVCQCSYSSDPVLITRTTLQYIALHIISICQSKYIALRCIAVLLHIVIL